MIFDIRLPSITAPTDAGKIEEIRSYLFQTVKEINFALNSIDGVNPTEVESKELDGNSLFAVIKPLIIRSSDIINYYYDIYKRRFDELYVSYVDIENLTNDIEKLKEDVKKLNDWIIAHDQAEVVGSIITFASSCADGMTSIVTNSATTEMPTGYVDCMGFIHKASGHTLIQLTDLSTGNIATNVYSGVEWSGWKFLTPQ